jgi:hypothetical protein
MSDSPTITQQYSFSVGEGGETDGIEPSEETVETDLETWGADVDHRERDTRIERAEATSFGVDDRPEVTSTDAGEQGALFANTTDDQQTLTGERAASQCLFESDDTDRNDTDTEPAANTNDEPTSRAVATDGGHVEDPGDDEPDEDDKTDTEDADASEKMMVAVPRKDLAGVADALDAERETIERNAGEGPKTETLAWLVEECRLGLSLLAINDETATISRTTAAAAADQLQAAAKTETGDYAEELRRVADLLRDALDEQPPDGEDEHAEKLQKPTTSDGGRGEDDTDTTASDGEPDTEETTFDPHQHVPDEIDLITADGIEQVHDHLSDDNAAEYAEASVEEQAAFLWDMVDRGVIDLNVGGH